MILTSYIKTAKIILIIASCSYIVWLYRDYKQAKFEAKIQTENNHQTRLYDSLRFMVQKYDRDDLKEHLAYNDPELKKKLEANNIKLNRIEKLISSTYKYKDTTRAETDITPLVDAIKNNIPRSQQWIDTTKCMTIGGVALYDGNTLKIVVNDREFNNKSNSVQYWERKQWKFLFIKSKFLGKIQMTQKAFDECGESKTILIEKKE